MKKILLAAFFALTGFGQAQAGEASALVYIHPDKLERPTQLGLIPYYIHYAWPGKLALKAALSTLSASYPGVTQCDGVATADLIVWVRPRIKYNPLADKVYTEVEASFHLGDGRLLWQSSAWGEQRVMLRSQYMDDALEQAFHQAMQQVSAGFANDAAAQQRLSEWLSKDGTPIQCGLVSVLGQVKVSE